MSGGKLGYSETKRENLKRVLSLVSSGHSIQDMSAELRVSVHTVYSYLRELGLGNGKWRKVKGQPQPSPSPTDKEEVKKLYDSGLTIREIATKLNVSRTTILNKLQSANYVPARENSSQYIEIDMEKVKEAYEGGKTWLQIARQFKISPKTLRKKVQASPIKIKQRVTRVELPDAELLRNYKNGLPIGYLAEKYEVHRKTIIRRLRSMGAKVRVNS